MSGDFFKGIAELLEVLLKAVSKGLDVKDQRRRRETIRDLLAASIVAGDIVSNGKALLEMAGIDPVQKVTEMNEAERRPYASQCLQMLRQQMNRLESLSRLLEDAPVIQLLDAQLKRELDAIIGTKQEGLMSIAAPLGIYLGLGAFPDDNDEKQYGTEIACMRYQAEVMFVVLAGNRNGGDPHADVHIDIPSATANLNELQAAADRLQKRVGELTTTEEVIILAKDAEKRARESVRQAESA
jgi:hypothetical protein